MFNIQSDLPGIYKGHKQEKGQLIKTDPNIQIRIFKMAEEYVSIMKKGMKNIKKKKIKARVCEIKTIHSIGLKA